MLNYDKRYTAIVLAAAFVAGTAAVNAADFGVTTSVQNSLEVVNVQDFDIGTVLAVASVPGVTGGALYDQGVGAIIIDADGTVEPNTNGNVRLDSLTNPTPAQGSVLANNTAFTITMADTSAIAQDVSGADSDQITEGLASQESVELVHETGNPGVPSLYLYHFTIGDVSGGVATEGATAFGGEWTVAPAFGTDPYVFNIGATLSTEPNGAALGSDPIPYQEGAYTGTFEVTASY